MLEQFMRSVGVHESFENINDKLLYVDHVDHKYTYNTVVIDPMTAYRYQGNLYGLFREMNMAPNLFLLALYLNGLNNPHNYDGTKLEFKIPVNVPIPIH